MLFILEKLYALAKDVKEKERQERIKMREKSEVTSDVSIVITSCFIHGPATPGRASWTALQS